MARPAASAVNAALRSLKALNYSTADAAAVEAFLVAKRLEAQGIRAPKIVDVNDTVTELFQVLPGHPRGRLRPFHWEWLVADLSGRKTIWNQTTRNADNRARRLFRARGSGASHRPDIRAGLRHDAASMVGGYLEPTQRPSRQALALLLLRDEEDLDPRRGWNGVISRLRAFLNVSAADLRAFTTSDNSLPSPFGQPEWEADLLDTDLAPDDASVDPTELDPSRYDSDDPVDLPEHVKDEIDRVVDALQRYGHRKIVALAGVPGTSKSHVARIAARRYAADAHRVMELQFSPGYSYEEFIEGPWLSAGKAEVRPGALLELNNRALAELKAAETESRPPNQFVLLIEEFTRADLPSVLGELFTYVEYRGAHDTFFTRHDRIEPKRIAPNLAILTTYNPTDRSAVNLDAALARRLHVLAFPPREDLLREMLEAPTRSVPATVIARLVALFAACRQACTEDGRLGEFDSAMPFGHAVFSEVLSEADLHALWTGELRPLLVRPRGPVHPLFNIIEDRYPWTDAEYREVTFDPGATGADAADDTARATPTDNV